MAYTTINDDIVRKCPELKDRLGETIESKKLAKIVGKYEQPGEIVAPKVKRVSKPRAAAKVTKKTSTRKKK